MGRDRRRAATGRGSRWSRKLHTLERLEPRCVLNGTAPWVAPVNPPVSQGHGNIIASDLVAPPPSSVVEPVMKSDDYLNGRSHSSPLKDGYNVHSLVPTESFSVSKEPYQTISLSFSDPLEAAFWSAFYERRGFATEVFVEQSDTFSIDGSMKAPPDYSQHSMSPQSGAGSSYQSTGSSSGDSTHGTHNLGPDLSFPDGPSGAYRNIANANGVSSETTPASAAYVAGAAQTGESRDVGHATQVGRSSVFDSSAAGQFNSAAVAATSTTDSLGDSSLGQTASMFKGDQQPAVNQALAGTRILSGTAAKANAAQSVGHSLSAGEAVQMLEGKAALADLPLDLRRMEQALESVVSEVKMIGPEVARWLDGVHAAPVTIAIAAAAVAGGSIYYWRRRSTRRADRPEDEASSSWLFARLQPTPE